MQNFDNIVNSDNKKIYFRLPENIIDSHCHGRDLLQKHKTTMHQVLLEAALGNISTTVFMPNTDPALTTTRILEVILEIIKQVRNDLNLKNQQYVYFGANDFNLAECKKALEYEQVVGIKIYPLSSGGAAVTTSNGKIGISSEEVLLKLMILTKNTNKVIAVHPDDPEIIKIEGNTIKAETRYIKKILRLAKLVPGIKIVFCHVSCQDSVELILRARDKGIDAYIEIAPHYLFFDNERTNWNPEFEQVFYTCYCNLRDSKNRLFLIELIKKGYPFVFIGSDSACHTEKEKLANEKLGGMPSNQELVASIVSLAVEHNISERIVADLLCFNVAELFGFQVSQNMKKYRLIQRTNTHVYNAGRVVNPWVGLNLYFPELTQE